LININTASAPVLACIPGIGTDNAPGLVSYRETNPSSLTSVAWVTQVLNTQDATKAGPYITTESFQFSADIVAVGRYGRGYGRVRFLFDTSDGSPKIRYRQDLARLGWALGSTVRQNLLLANNTRTR
jgi:type II secretory pathway component PulK